MWGLHLVKWYLCNAPSFRGGAVIKAEDVADITVEIPDVTGKWEAWEIEIALNILKNDVGEDGNEVGIIKWLDEEDEEDDDEDDEGGQNFVLIESRLPSPAKLTREVRGEGIVIARVCVCVCGVVAARDVYVPPRERERERARDPPRARKPKKHKS